jgi:hypothetical protein
MIILVLFTTDIEGAHHFVAKHNPTRLFLFSKMFCNTISLISSELGVIIM